MKKIIKSMWSEITILQKELKEERREKDDYAEVFNQFAGQMGHMRSNSKNKYYFPEERQSHKPTPPHCLSN